MFDTPVFKVLSRNDTGAAAGHQGGFVIPKAIENYFPDVVGETSEASPTIDVTLIADLIVDSALVATVQTRYQYQTWGGTRSPERRLTANLGALRNAAAEGDVVLFSRRTDHPERFALTLLKKGTQEHAVLLEAVGGARWGLVPGIPAPVGNSDLRTAVADIEELQNQEFQLLDHDRQVIESRVKRKARNAGFRKKLLELYGERCQVSDHTISVSGIGANVDAAHIVPIELGGTDDPRNGLLMTKDFHWAFDNGLFGIDDDYKVIVPTNFIEDGRNVSLKRISGRPLNFGETSLRPHPEAIAWHRSERLGQV